MQAIQWVQICEFNIVLVIIHTERAYLVIYYESVVSTSISCAIQSYFLKKSTHI